MKPGDPTIAFLDAVRNLVDAAERLDAAAASSPESARLLDAVSAFGASLSVPELWGETLPVWLAAAHAVAKPLVDYHANRPAEEAEAEAALVN